MSDAHKYHSLFLLFSNTTITLITRRYPFFVYLTPLNFIVNRVEQFTDNAD